MANRRSLIVETPVGPSFLPGLIMIADTITLSTGNVLTLTFPAKTVIAVLVSSSADVDTEKVVWASSITSDVATVTITATSAGTNELSYLILASMVETIPANVSTASLAETPVR